MTWQPTVPAALFEQHAPVGVGCGQVVEVQTVLFPR
jgi:hypothetical protein